MVKIKEITNDTPKKDKTKKHLKKFKVVKSPTLLKAVNKLNLSGDGKKGRRKSRNQIPRMTFEVTDLPSTEEEEIVKPKLNKKQTKKENIVPKKQTQKKAEVLKPAGYVVTKVSKVKEASTPSKKRKSVPENTEPINQRVDKKKLKQKDVQKENEANVLNKMEEMPENNAPVAKMGKRKKTKKQNGTPDKKESILPVKKMKITPQKNKLVPKSLNKNMLKVSEASTPVKNDKISAEKCEPMKAKSGMKKHKKKLNAESNEVKDVSVPVKEENDEPRIKIVKKILKKKLNESNEAKGLSTPAKKDKSRAENGKPEAKSGKKTPKMKLHERNRVQELSTSVKKTKSMKENVIPEVKSGKGKQKKKGSQEKAFTPGGNFKWSAEILNVLKNAKKNTFSIQKLRRKVLASYRLKCGDTSANPEQLLVYFSKVLQTTPNVEIVRTQAKLKI